MSYNKCTLNLSIVMLHPLYSGCLVTSSQLLEVLQPFCSDNSFSAQSRRAVLGLIEKVGRTPYYCT